MKNTSLVNDKFKKATKAEKRVMIAKDVLAQLKTNRYFAESGAWVQEFWSEKHNPELRYEDTSVAEAFDAKEIQQCSVCALGSLFMSCAVITGKTTLMDLDEERYYLGELIQDNRAISNGLDKIFSKSQLKLIESYFEGNDGYFVKASKDQDRIENFFAFEPDIRLKMIMKNIIENKGTFIPSKLKTFID